MNGILLQIKSFSLIMGMGIGLGFFLHFYLRCLIQMRLRKKTVFAVDFLLWLGLIAIVFAGLLKINAGEVRSYVWIALLTGVWLYYHMMAKKMKGLVNTMADHVAVATRKSFRAVIIPLHKIKRTFKKFSFRKTPPPTERE